MQGDSRTTNAPTGRAHVAKRCMALVGAVAISLLAACSTDSFTAPAAPVTPERSTRASKDLLTGLGATLDSVTGLERLVPAAAITQSKTFDKDGGTLDIPELGFTLVVPDHALWSRTLKITVTSLPGNVVAYDFEPHGTVFKRPLVFTQKLTGTKWLQVLLSGRSLSGAYFKDTKQVNNKNGRAKVDETYDALTFNESVSFSITHFSGYMVSTGRAEPMNDF